MKNVRKSLHRSRNSKQAKKRAAQRAAKERHRLARASFAVSAEYAAALVAASPPCAPTPATRSGFRVTITCLDDGERVQFDSARGPFGLTVSPTLAGRKVAAVLRHYLPQS